MLRKKNLGQVFTPDWLVEEMLDHVDYKGNNVLDKKLLEPSCGDGSFLVAAAQRLITAGKEAGLNTEQIHAQLEANIWGVDYDEEILPVAAAKLDSLTAAEGIPVVEWNLVHSDALLFEHYGEFDFVVGNPPYIRIHKMDEALKGRVKQFALSTGLVDLYIIFFELGLRWLNNEGKLVYVSPNSWMKNSSQKAFRNSLINSRKISKVVNYGTKPIFGKDASTYASVVVLHNKGYLDSIEYVEEGMKDKWTNFISYNSLGSSYQGESLNFASPDDEVFLTSNKTLGRALGSVCQIQNGVCTLLNSVFLAPPADAEDELIAFVAKSSIFKGVFTEKIIYPYKTVDGKVVGLAEEEIAKYPVIYEHFMKNKEALLKRDRDKSSAWFHYGRSQGLTNLSKRKLVFSHVMKGDQKTIKSFILPENTVVYSGLYITETVDGLPLEDIARVIESEDFCRYLKLHGKDLSGGYKSVGNKPVKSFQFV